MDFSAKLVSRENLQTPNFKPTKCLKFGEEKQQSDMKFAAKPKGADGNGMSGVCFDERSSEKERKGNALASGADEGRDKLRKASGSCK